MRETIFNDHSALYGGYTVLKDGWLSQQEINKALLLLLPLHGAQMAITAELPGR